jgi:cystathionine gamma-lyase
LLSQVRQTSQNLKLSYIDLTQTDSLAEAMTAETRLVWVETPTNPNLKIADLARIAEIAKKKNPDVILACDNTFASPINQRPLELGFNVVMHSATKYLGGHSDVLAGILVTNKPELAERIRFVQKSLGAVLGPFDSYLLLRGIKTLAIRIERHNASSLKIAKWLEAHPKIDRVVHPGLESHPQHAIAKKQMDGFGGMITMFIKGGLDEARTMLERVRIFALAESLGGVESLIEHPAIMTHASLPADKRAELGISDTLIRLSVGIEDVDDLIGDLEQALK